MRLTRIGFGGFRRLADTSCNVDGRLVAFLGPNEAGKSSVLAGLAWLADEDDNAALESSLRSRSIPAFGVGRKVVTAEFVLDDEDRAALAGLDSDVVPRLLRISRTAGGTRLWETVPVLTRRPGPTEEAAAALREVVGRLGAAMARPHGQEAPADLADTVLAALGEPDRVPTPEVTSAFEELNAWLRMPFTSTPEGDAEPVETPPDRRDVACADLLDAATARLASESPGFHATEVLRHRVPDFLLFGEDDRVLLSQYNLADRALRSAVPAALTNLLAVGGTTVAEVIRARDADTARVRTLERRTNDRLRERLQPTWRQSTLAVRIALDGDLLQILVDELGPDGETTPIAERSDGVRAFLALVCFLADKERDSDIQPILMIDEAETHLHYDAQADLLEVLLRHVKASKVLYTTHSPGCLPPDLGTGVRLVARDPERPGASQLKSDFWRSDEPGFNPLLFAMGAGAAAFSVCRAAVLAEGASDMILLPSLLRAATGLDYLGYQVAPGLAHRPDGMDSAAVAARIVYLADGDRDGKKYADRLLDDGVPPERVHRLPDGYAVEDLLEPDAYLDAVRAVMTDSGHTGPRVTPAKLSGTGPIAGRLQRWCRREGLQCPGKTAVASHLVQELDRIRITRVARTELRALHDVFARELSTSGHGTPDARATSR